MGAWDQFWTGDDDLKAYQAALEELQAAYDDNIAMQGKCEPAMQDYADSVEEAANATVSYEDAVSNAIASVNDDLSTLVENYQAAYGAALESVQGQYALWDQAAEVTATSADSINSALESQISYWEAYKANLAGLTERSADIEGLSDMIASFADGRSDSVNAVAGMVSATDEELAAINPATAAMWAEVRDILGNGMDRMAGEWGGCIYEEMYPVPLVLTHAYDVIQAYGYRKSDESGCTRGEVKERVLDGSKPSAKAMENAEKVNAWLVGLDQVVGDRWIGDLERNGSSLALSGCAKAKHFGYMPIAYER